MGVGKDNENNVLEAAPTEHTWAQPQSMPSSVTRQCVQRGIADPLWTSDCCVLLILEFPKLHCLLSLTSVYVRPAMELGTWEIGRQHMGFVDKLSYQKEA